MTEIPMAEAGPSRGAATPEVRNAGYLLLLASITGLIVGGVEYAIWEEELALLGVVLAIVGFILATQVMKGDYSAWMIGLIFNIIAIFLYATGYNWGGVALSLICVIYFMLPNVKGQFEQNR
ncbi:MAG: hypothetical protein ACW99G_16695 [Candidatus Thorarchaeota archaeon]|jgi:nicotinamide riboside transporter PnuC